MSMKIQPKTDIISGIAIINGAHDINVKDYTIQGDAHYDIMNGGDGKYLNRCTGLVENLSITPPGGANLDMNGNCYSTQFGFDPRRRVVNRNRQTIKM